MRVFGLILFLVCTIRVGFGQELNCQVQVIAPTLQSNPMVVEILEQLQTTILEFVNNTQWTSHKYKPEERIDCGILITINSMKGNEEFTGTIQVTSTRPTYNANYASPLLNYRDEAFKFNYQRGAPVIFTPDAHTNNLASVLAYYCYVILALDYDTFSPEGGTEYYNKAKQIVTNAPQGGGWEPGDGRTRYWLVENPTQSLFKGYRKCFYEYHRNGFDLLYSEPEKGIQNILASLKLLNEVQQVNPNSFNMQLFFLAKADEIYSLFKGAEVEDRNKAYNLLVKLDPANLNKYDKMKNGQ